MIPFPFLSKHLKMKMKDYVFTTHLPSSFKFIFIGEGLLMLIFGSLHLTFIFNRFKKSYIFNPYVL